MEQQESTPPEQGFTVRCNADGTRTVEHFGPPLDFRFWLAVLERLYGYRPFSGEPVASSMSTKDVATRLGIRDSEVRALVHAGTLPADRDRKGHFRYYEDDVRQYERHRE